MRMEAVSIPEWGGEVYVRSFGGEARDSWEGEQAQLYQADKGHQNFRARLVVACVCDQDGNLLFKPQDAKWLGTKNAKALDRIFEVAKRLNGIGEAEIDELKKTS